MGVSLGYRTAEKVDRSTVSAIRKLAAKKNREYDWWCEAIWIGEKVDESGAAFGFTKLFCMIDDEDVDTYMAYLDVKEIVDFFCEVSKQTKTAWDFAIEGSELGKVEKGKRDAALRENLEMFLDLFPGDFESVKKKGRKQILREWKDR